MTVEEMREIKKARGYTYEQIAERSGVPLGTVQKIFSGETQSPRYATLQALEAAFREEKVSYYFDDSKGSGVEESALYRVAKKQGDYTIEDYYALPDERRVELIDGVIYDMSSPSFVHQGVAGEVYLQIANFIRYNKGECIARIAPVDVRLDCDNKTMVQPDVLVTCDKSKIKRWGIMGAPDFVLEVLSKSTKRKDSLTKTSKYAAAGVREYWIIDPDKKKLLVYDFENDAWPALYGLHGKIPVGIYQGRLEIDLDMVAEAIQDYPDGGRDEVFTHE